MTDQSAESRLLSLIAIIGDPKASGARLAELKKQSDANAELLEKADQAKAEAEAQLKAAMAARNEAAALHDQAVSVNQGNDKLRKELTAQAEQLQAREKQLEQHESDVKYRDSKVGEKISFIELREKTVAERELAAEEAMGHAKALLASYDEAKHRAALVLAPPEPTPTPKRVKSGPETKR